MSSAFEERLKKARLNLILDVPFFGSLAFKLATKADTTVKTTITDGREIRINPEYAAKLTDSQLAGVLVESIGHCAMGHLWRREHRDLGLWNKAADQTIWNVVAGLQNASDGRIMLPPNGTLDPQFDNLSTEEVFHLMRADQDSGENSNEGYDSPGAFGDPADDGKPGAPGDNSNNPGNGGDSQGDDSQDNGDSPAPQSLQDEWKSAVTQAATVERQRQRGNLPAWMKSLVEDLIEPRVPWTEYVREFCHRLARDDYSFRRPNRRFTDFILPSLKSEKLGPIVGAFDTSGSIFCIPEVVQSILSEFQGVLDLCRPEMMTLIDCDTQVHQRVDFMPGDTLLSFVPEGGGGTDFRPVFDAIADLPEPPACLIFLTDLEGWFPEVEPPFPVLWANFGHPRAKAPFGTTIHVPLEV